MPLVVPLRAYDPTAIGGYTLRGRLGEGGQGVVYLGAAASGELVAIKWLRPELAGDPAMVQRFLREVSAAQRVAPFCTAALIGTGVEQDRPYIVSEYVDGPSLQQVVRESGPISGASLHRLAIGTATALAAIHQAGIVHRDFKPANVLLAQDGPRVIDFGVSRAVDLTLTVNTGLVGTPAYMAPEQFGGEPVGPATDMFAWAGTMVYAATGRPAFGGDSLPSVMHRVLNGEPDLSSLDGRLLELVTACLDKDPARRPTAEQVILGLLKHAPTTPQILQEGAAAAAEAPAPPEGNRFPSEGAPAAGTPRGTAPQILPPEGLPKEAGAATGRSTPQGERFPGAPAAVPRAAAPQILPPSAAAHRDGVPTHPAGGGGERRRLLVGGGAVAVAVLLVAVIAIVFQANQPSATPNTAVAARSPSASSSAVDSSTPTPVPTTGVVTRTLPGLENFELFEHESDPVTLVSYDAEDAKTKESTTYARDPKEGFAKHPNAVAAVLSPNGRYLAKIGDKFVDGQDAVEITDLQTGVRTQVKTARKPLQANFEQWSRDSKRILLILERKVGKTWKNEGFVIVTVGQTTAQVVRPGVAVGDSGYAWAPSGDQVVAEVKDESGSKLQFFSTQGEKVREVAAVGEPPADDPFSPSGRSFVTDCPHSAEGTLCIWDTRTGRQVRRVYTDCAPLLGWYDDNHLFCWTDREDAYGRDLVEVVDFKGEHVRTLLAVGDGSLLSPTFSYKPEFVS